MLSKAPEVAGAVTSCAHAPFAEGAWRGQGDLMGGAGAPMQKNRPAPSYDG